MSLKYSRANYTDWSIVTPLICTGQFRSQLLLAATDPNPNNYTEQTTIAQCKQL